jgi:chromosome segregation ATPase
MRDTSPSGKLRFVCARILCGPESWGIWVVAVLLCAVLGAGWPLAAAAAAQAGVFFWRLRDERYLRRILAVWTAREEDRTEEAIRDLLEGMDYDSRQRVQYALRIRQEIAQEARADDVPSYARADLDRLARELLPLVERVARIAKRNRQLSSHLDRVDERELERTCDSLRKRIAAATDPVARGQYEEALRAREAELQTYRSIAQASARIASQLENVEAALASWRAKVLRIKALDDTASLDVGASLQSEIARLSGEIDTVDRSVAEALAAEPQAAMEQTVQIAPRSGRDA